MKSDGHCGFRAVAFCLGLVDEGSFLKVRSELVNKINRRKLFYIQTGGFRNPQELEECLVRINTHSPEPVGKEHWMAMPMNAEPLANAFSTPVFYFSTSGSFGFFPHFTPANNNPPIFIAFIPEQSHFVALQLKDPLNFPFPYPIGLNSWIKHSDFRVRNWQDKYSNSIELGKNNQTF